MLFHMWKSDLLKGVGGSYNASDEMNMITIVTEIRGFLR